MRSEFGQGNYSRMRAEKERRGRVEEQDHPVVVSIGRSGDNEV